MQGSESLITDIVILSWPGALLDEKDIIYLTDFMSRDCVKLEFICYNDFWSLGSVCWWRQIVELSQGFGSMRCFTSNRDKEIIKFICNLFSPGLFWISRVDWLCNVIARDTTPSHFPFRTGILALSSSF